MEKSESLTAERNSNTYSRWSKEGPRLMEIRSAALFGVCAGAADFWTATAVPYLQKPYTVTDGVTVPGITYREAAWIVSLYYLGSFVGALPARYLANLLGRRRLMLIMAVPMFLSWLVILCGHNSIPQLYTARFVQGFTCGVVTLAYYMSCDEIAETRERAILGIRVDLLFTVGMVCVYCCGAIISYLEMTIACPVLPLVFAVIFYTTPESPLYLLTNGQTDKAKKSLQWLRGVGTGQSAEIEVELNEMESFINRPTHAFGSYLETPETFKDMNIVFSLMVFRHLCGINAILAYTVHVSQTAGNSWDPYLCTAIFGVAQFVSTLVANFIGRLDSKRILPTICGAGMGIGFLAILIHSHLNQGTEIKFLEWLPFIAVNLNVVTFSVGLGPAPWFKILIAVCLNSALAFFVTKFFPIIMNDFGLQATCVTLAVICLVGTIISSRRG